MNKAEENVRLRGAVQCAPVLAEIKVSNLLILDQANPLTIMENLDGTGLSVEYLYSGARKSVWLIYWMEGMNEIINRPEHQSFLRKLGYQDFSWDSVFRCLKTRYKAYFESKSPYPHELGLLLGYPLADVVGFIKHKGKNFLCSGYWKVYENAEEAKKTFERYRKVRREAERLAREGKGFWEMILGFRQEREIAAAC